MQQPLDDFGRLYAVYGGVFIGLSFIWGLIFDGMKVDLGDLIGSIVALVGVGIIMFWPRTTQDEAAGTTAVNASTPIGSAQTQPL